MTENTTATALQVSPRALVVALNKVTPAAAKPGGQTPAMERVLTYVSEGWLHLMATDRYRIHYTRVEVGADAPAFDRPLPVSLAKDLRAMSLATSNIPVTLEAPSPTALIVRGADGSQRDYGTAITADESDRADDLGRQVRALFAEALDVAASETVPGDELPQVSSVYLTEAVKAAQGSTRRTAPPVHFQVLSKRRVVISSPGSEEAFRALIMGQFPDSDARATLSGVHREMSAGLRAQAPRASEGLKSA